MAPRAGTHGIGSRFELLRMTHPSPALSSPFLGPRETALVSRTRLLTTLPHLRGTTLSVRNRAYGSRPCLLDKDRILVWQGATPVAVVGALLCRAADLPLLVAADNLARVEPRLDGFEAFIPSETSAALVEHALHPVLTLIERLTGLPLVCEEFTRNVRTSLAGSPDEVSVGFTVYDLRVQPLMRGWVRATPDVWQQFDFERAPALKGLRIGAVPLRLSLRLGRTRLSLGELRSLAPGDALRIWPRLPVAESRPRITLTDGAGFALQARLNADELILEHPVNMPEDTPPPTQGDPAGINADDMFSEIECDVSFELGALRMKVSDLARLRAGFAVRLGVRLVDQPVRIMVSGRMLGRGALAALGDELVVVVTETKALPEL